MAQQKSLHELFPDFPPGPLDAYRQQASFDWRQLKVCLEGEEKLRFKKHIFDTLEKDPLFHKDLTTPTLHEHRALNQKRWRRLMEYQFFTKEELFSEFWKQGAFIGILETYDQGLSGRYALTMGVFYSAILSMGTERHKKFLEMAERNQLVGCFCLTEISHGSNTKAIRTTATYDPHSKCYLMNTPDLEAAKCWSGNLGQAATYAVVFAQLLVPKKGDGQLESHGMHAFVVQVRDEHSLRPLPGITIGDMGAKPGAWNGVENGWAMFSNLPVPRENLLNRGGDVSPDGVYTTPHKSTRSRQATNLGALSAGRVGIVAKGVLATQFASVIAIRYSAVRRQFGPEDSNVELPVIEYPLQQYRLFPYLAATYTLGAFYTQFNDKFMEYMFRVVGGEKSDEMAEMGREVHGLSSCAKPIATWLGVNSLGEARMACGGHGYLNASRLSDLRNDFDPSQTFEGDNNMLLQQTANYLLTLLEDKRKNNIPIKSPMGSVDFLDSAINNNTATWKGFGKDLTADVLTAYRWLVVYLLHKSDAKIADKLREGKSPFTARNESAVYHCHTLAIAYGEHTIISWFDRFLRSNDVPANFRPVLQRLCSLFASWTLEKHLSTLYMGGYCSGSEFGEHIRREILRLCSELKPDAVALCDTIAPPDFVLHSALGHSDGQAYKHIFTSMIQTPGSMERPPWWTDLVEFFNANKSKL